MAEKLLAQLKLPPEGTVTTTQIPISKNFTYSTVTVGTGTGFSMFGLRRSLTYQSFLRLVIYRLLRNFGGLSAESCVVVRGVVVVRRNDSGVYRRAVKILMDSRLAGAGHYDGLC
jgi:hypothetical protein